MGYADLREFVKRLEKEGELKRVKKEVDPVLEIAEVAQRLRQQALNGAPPARERLAAEKVGPFDKPGSGLKAPTPFGLGPALLFEKPKGSRYPLLINTFGSVRRMALAFEVEKLDDVAARIRGFMDMQTPQGLFDKIKMLPKLAELGSFFPKSVKEGACKEIVRKGNDVNLLDFPILKCWPQDG